MSPQGGIREGGWPVHRLTKIGAGEPERQWQAPETVCQCGGILAASGFDARMVNQDLSGIVVVQHPHPAQPAQRSPRHLPAVPAGHDH